MNTTSEIKNKEKSLAELMVKILKEPLNPLEMSLDELKDELFEATSKLAEIDDKISASALDHEKISKTLRKIRDEDFPSFSADLHQYLANKFESEFQKIVNALDNNVSRFDESLNVVADTLIERLDKTVCQQIKLELAIEEIGKSLASQLETLMEMKQSTLKEIQYSRERTESSSLQLTSIIEIEHNEMLAGFEGLSMKIKESMSENLTIGQQAIKSIDSNQKVIEDIIVQKNADLVAAISSNKIKLKNLMFTTSILFIVMSIYIGYDIWSRFN